jgi:hypothetical protein
MAKASSYITGKFVTINIEVGFASATQLQAFRCYRTLVYIFQFLPHLLLLWLAL